MSELAQISKITVEELAEDIEILIWEDGIECFKITEAFPDRNVSYLVRLLKVESEDGFVICSDYDKLILTNEYFIMVFLRSHLLLINKIISDGIPHGELYFKDGTVKIEIAG